MSSQIKRIVLRMFLFISLVSPFAEADAVTYTSITAIGDSLFDGGNEPTAVISAYKLYGVPANYIPIPGYYNFKYCDGYTSVEYMAYFMGLYDTGHFFNYAVAGLATSNVQLILQQIYNRTPALDPTGLYVIYLGGNDIFQSTISRDQTAENIKNALVDMYNHGARYFMVLNQPKLSDAPNYNKLPTADIESVNIAYKAINSALKTKLDALSFTANVVQVDMPTFSSLINTNGRSVGFVNLTDACVVNKVPCATPHSYIYWDDVHLSDNTNSFLGFRMKSLLNAAALN